MIKMDTQTCIVLCVFIVCIIAAITWVRTIQILGEDKCFCETLEVPTAGIVRDCLKNKFCAIV